MRFLRNSVALGAAGLFTGLAYHNLSSKRQFLISAADSVNLDIENVISKDVKTYLEKYAPVMKHGFPSYDSLRNHGNYVLSYDAKNRVAKWVMEHLTSDMMEAKSCECRRRNEYYEDETIHDYFRSTKGDYKNSGYDKGHLAAAGNHKYSQNANDKTFYLSNMTPQNPFFNQGIWKVLEGHVRKLVKIYKSVYVCTGPLYLPRILNREEEQQLLWLCENLQEEQLWEFGNEEQQSVQLSKTQRKKRKRKEEQEFQLSEREEENFKRKSRQVSDASSRKSKYVIYEVIGDALVAVPTHFFKIILYEVKENKYDIEAYVIPNTPIAPKTPLQNFQFPKDAIERAAGFLVFHRLPPNAIRKINGKETSVSSESEDDFWL